MEDGKQPPVNNDNTFAGFDLTNVNLIQEQEKEASAKSKVPAAKKPQDIIPEELYSWLSGEGEMPQSLRQLGDDISSKMNWFIVVTVLKQYQRIPQLFDYITQAETQLYAENDFNGDAEGNVDIDTIRDKYGKATAELEKVLEFARKFTLQNKEVLGGSQQSEQDKDLLDKIKRLNPSAVQKIISIIEKEDLEPEPDAMLNKEQQKGSE
jgi:hypothetical protein